jgi:hypothetical protein
MVGPLKIEGFTFHTKNGKDWIGFPSREYTDQEGKRKFWQIVRIEDEDRYKAFQEWAKNQVRDIFNEPEPAAAPTRDNGSEIPF